MTMTVGIGGLGAIGLALAKSLDRGIDGLRLVAVSARDKDRARANVAGFAHPPEVVELGELARADIVVEAAPASVLPALTLSILVLGSFHCSV